MDADLSGTFAVGTAALALGAYLAALLLIGLLAAFSRVNNLHRNGLIEPENLDGILVSHLDAPGRFVSAVAALYLAATAVGVFATGRSIASLWPQAGGWRLYLPTALVVLAAWSVGGALVKNAAAGASLGYARWMGRILLPACWLLRPWTALLDALDTGGDALWSVDAAPHLSAGEIRSLISEDEEGVGLEDDEREMIHSIIEFHDSIVREIMVPRIDVVSLPADATVDDAIRTVDECNHSRIPVYEGSIDRITGLLYAKDLLALVRDGRMVDSGRTVGDLARPAYFIPESKKLDETLAELKAERIHMAIVIDEYGGTAGLVTMEDVLEEIVGEIEDEFDAAESLFEWIDARTLRVDPKIDLEDLIEVLGVDLPTDEGSETLAGLIYEAAGRVPEKGDQVTIAGLAVVVEGVADQRILQVRLAAAEDLPGHREREKES